MKSFEWLKEHRLWPKDKPLPNEEQWELARERMEKEVQERYKNGYEGDWGFTLEFTVGTYNRATWWHLFYPKDPPMTLIEGLPG